jgi:hypothetical protein
MSRNVASCRETPYGALGDFFGPGTTVGIPFAAQIGIRLSFQSADGLDTRSFEKRVGEDQTLARDPEAFAAPICLFRAPRRDQPE